MENYLETAPCCYFAFSDNGELFRLNQTLCEALGYTKEELTGRKVETLFPVSTSIFYQTHFFPLLKMHGHAEEIFIFLKAKDGKQLPVLMNAKRGESEGIIYNECACIVVQNRKRYEDELVTAKKEAETALFENTALKQVKDELTRQAEKLDEHIQLVNKQNNQLKQLNRVATHDLQEPVRKVLVFANMLRDLPPGDSKQKEKLQKLVKVANLLRETISGMQQYVWLNESTIQPMPVDLHVILINAKNLLAEELKEDLLEIKSEKLPVIRADKHQIHLLFYHILTNAVQYRKPGEKAIVHLTATILKKNLFKAVEDRYKYKDFLKIVVRDEGIGFDPQYKNQVFELFKKLHHVNRRGLGLSFCKLIVENHGGWIEAESTPFEGTSISIFFPGGVFAEDSATN